MSHKPSCGPHAELVRTDGIRISRCPCGTLHVNFARNGVTVQLTAEHFQEAAQAMSLARSLLAGQSSTATARSEDPAPGRFVTVLTPDPRRGSSN